MGAGSRKKWWLAAVAVAVLAAVIIANTGGESALKVDAEHPCRGAITQIASAYGRIRPVDQVKISPDVSGEITDIYFAEGDTVKKGDLLLKIKQETYRSAVIRSQAALGSAIKGRDVAQIEAHLKRLEYDRLQQLYKSDATCLAQLEQAEMAYESAKARAEEAGFQVAAAEASLQTARSELGKTLVYAPMDGIITSLRVKRGERVVGTSTMAGTEMMTIADLGQMEVVVQLGENDICSVSTGDRVDIKPDAFASGTLPGLVNKIASSSVAEGAAGASSDFEVRIAIDSGHLDNLRPGMSATVTIHTGSKNDILTVPLQAVTVRDGREIVWTIDDNMRVHATPVGCGIQDFTKVEITSGLTPGDLIVSGPFQAVSKTLSEADKVKLNNGIK